MSSLPILRVAKQSYLPSAEFEARYQNLTLIAHGGSGEVYSAWDSRVQRNVAVKRIKTKGVDDSVLANPWGEAVKLAAISHPNIVSVYDTGQDQMVPYIVMEYIEGETVEESIPRGVFSLSEFAELASQALEGVIAAHRVGLIHRDLKPANIMLTAHSDRLFQIKLLDFGMAKFLTKPSAQTMNLDGTISGSVCWISPEQVTREPVDERCDLYSLGCVFYYALSGHRPFDGPNSMAILQAKLDHRIVPLGDLCPDLPPLVVQWVMAMFNLRPEHRYQTGTKALEVLQYILRMAQTPEATPEVATETPESQFPAEEAVAEEAAPIIVAYQRGPAVFRSPELNPWVIVGIAAAVLLILSWSAMWYLKG